jgi:hypothetical protein
MASEIDIRDAIVARMISALAVFDPTPPVWSHDISGLLESGSYNGLTDEDGVIHLWVVTQRSMLPEGDYKAQNGAKYELAYNLTQIYQYRSGTALLNSVRDASLERDAIINAFSSRIGLPPILKHAEVQPVEWPTDQIDKPEPITRGTARQSKAILRARNFYGPVACS